MNQPILTPNGEAIVLNVAWQDETAVVRTGRYPLRQSDLFALRDATCLAGLRNGRFSSDPSALAVQYRPVRRNGASKLSGLVVELSHRGNCVQRVFGPQCFGDALQAALEEQLASGRLQVNDKIRYWLSCEAAAAIVAAQSPAAGIQVRQVGDGRQPQRARLADYLDNSRQQVAGAATVQPSSEEDRATHFPLFICRDAWEQGRAFACRHENLESAAIFTGRLMQDLDVPELFVVIDACIEATHADEQPYSVMLTSQSWAYVHKVLDQRRRRLGRPSEIIVGSVHGHPFLPAANEEGRRTCAECDKKITCTQTTAAASSDDVRWHRSVFTRQPWAILAIWGWNARGEEVWQAYGTGDGTLAPRTIRVLND